MGNIIAKEKLIGLYGEKCMLSRRETRLTFHHLHKKCEGGEGSLDNGALLNREAHDYLHYLEKTDRPVYEELNECICLYKRAVLLQERECLKMWEEVQEIVRSEMAPPPKARGRAKVKKR